MRPLVTAGHRLGAPGAGSLCSSASTETLSSPTGEPSPTPPHSSASDAPFSLHTSWSGLVCGQASSPGWEPPGPGLSHPRAQQGSSYLVAIRSPWLGLHPPGPGRRLVWAPTVNPRRSQGETELEAQRGRWGWATWWAGALEQPCWGLSGLFVGEETGPASHQGGLAALVRMEAPTAGRCWVEPRSAGSG